MSSYNVVVLLDKKPDNVDDAKAAVAKALEPYLKDPRAVEDEEAIEREYKSEEGPRYKYFAFDLGGSRMLTEKEKLYYLVDADVLAKTNAEDLLTENNDQYRDITEEEKHRNEALLKALNPYAILTTNGEWYDYDHENPGKFNFRKIQSSEFEAKRLNANLQWSKFTREIYQKSKGQTAVVVSCLI